MRLCQEKSFVIGAPGISLQGNNDRRVGLVFRQDLLKNKPKKQTYITLIHNAEAVT